MISPYILYTILYTVDVKYEIWYGVIAQSHVASKLNTSGYKLHLLAHMSAYPGYNLHTLLNGSCMVHVHCLVDPCENMHNQISGCMLMHVSVDIFLGNHSNSDACSWVLLFHYGSGNRGVASCSVQTAWGGEGRAQ